MNSHPCKFQLHIGAHLFSACEAGGVNKPKPSRTPFLYRMARTKAEQVERCSREITDCRRAGRNSNLTPIERFGAMQGEVDWLVAFTNGRRGGAQQCAALQDGDGVHSGEIAFESLVV